MRDGVDGLLVPPRDPGALAEAAARILDDPALAAAPRAAGAGRAPVVRLVGGRGRAAVWSATLRRGPPTGRRRRRYHRRRVFAVWIVLGVVAVARCLGVVVLYNRLVSLRARVDNGWSQIDVQLRRRYDLIPNLVETVQGYAAHERELFEHVTEARARAIGASGVDEQAQAENPITAGLRQLIAVAENYPDLKANQNFLALQEELTGTESKIAYARQFYNDQVMKLNTAIQSFPSSLIANAFHFDAARVLRHRRARCAGPSRWTSSPDAVYEEIAANKRKTVLLVIGAIVFLGADRLRDRLPLRHRAARARDRLRIVAIALSISVLLLRRPDRAGLDPRPGGDRRRSNRGCTTSSRASRSRPACRSRGSTSCPSRRRTPSRPAATRSTPRSR